MVYVKTRDFHSLHLVHLSDVHRWRVAFTVATEIPLFIGVIALELTLWCLLPPKIHVVVVGCQFCWRPSCLSKEMPTIDMLMNHHGPMKNCHKLLAIGGIPHVHTFPPFRFPSTHPMHVCAGDSSDSERKSPRFSVNFPLMLRPPHLVSNPFHKSRTPKRTSEGMSASSQLPGFDLSKAYSN